MILAKADLYGIGTFITAFVGLMAFAVTQVSRIRSERAAKALLMAQGVSGKTAVEGFAILTDAQGKAIAQMQEQITSLRAEVTKCLDEKEAMQAGFQRQLVTELQKWFPNLPPPTSSS